MIIRQEEYPEGDEKFYTYDEMEAKFRELERDYPQYVKMISFGESFEGRNCGDSTSQIKQI